MSDLLKSAMKEISSLSATIATLRADAESLKQQRDDLRAADGTQEDVLRIARKQIAQYVEAYPERLQRTFANTMHHGVSTRSADGRDSRLGLFLARRNAGAPATLQDLEEAITFFLAPLVDPVSGSPLIESRLEDAIAAMKWNENAQPGEGRAAILEQLDQNIVAIEAKISDLRRGAASAGIVLGG